MSVSPSTILRLAPDVVVRYGTGIDVEITLGAERIVAGPHGVSVLEMFRTPMPMGEGLRRLGERAVGMQDWIELSAMVSTFAKIGILLDPAAQGAALAPEPGRFDSARTQVLMLDDATRTSSYLQAIAQVVRPGDVVVEVGTGTGVLSVAAARAGAARVYAIEASSIGRNAREVFAANGVADRVTLVEGLSSRVSLPERCDVLISEIIGRDPLEEELLEFTRDAVERFLKPGARLIPSRFEIFAVPVSFPDEIRRRWTFTSEAVEEWRARYGLDFSPLVASSRRSWWKMAVGPRRMASFGRLSHPVRMFERDLSAIKEVGFASTASARASASGSIDGVALHFSARLAPGLELANRLEEGRDDNSWDFLVWGMPSPVDVQEGDTIEVTMRHRVDGPPVELRVERP